jgi:hypothetical protein
MSTTVFEFIGVLGSGLNATSNPAPASLATLNPFPASPAHTQDVSAAWTAQARPGLFPDPQRDFLYNQPVALAFIPSAGASATYTVTIWKWDGVSSWLKPASNATRTYTGPCLDYIENPGQNAWFIQINSVSSGTLTIRFNQAVATAL